MAHFGSAAGPPDGSGTLAGIVKGGARTGGWRCRYWTVLAAAEATQPCMMKNLNTTSAERV